MSERVRVYEVGPAGRPAERGDPDPDGEKARFIELLAAAGLTRDRGDQLRRPDARSRSWPTRTPCSRGLPRAPGVRYPVLVPNERGLERARRPARMPIAVFTAATDAFTRPTSG